MNTQNENVPAVQHQQIKSSDNFLSSLEALVKSTDMIKNLCKQLMQTPHYAKLKEEGIFAIVMMANSLGIDVQAALNGRLGYDRGKVTIPSETMNLMIRQAGHSIEKDPVSNEKVCILTGKRKDNGDTIKVKYTIEEASRAGLTAKDNWKNHPQAMLFARCSSMLARQLFADVIGGCYTREEMDDENFINKNASVVDIASVIVKTSGMFSDGQSDELESLVANMPDIRERILSLYVVTKFTEIHATNFEFIKNWATKELSRRQVDSLKTTEDAE